MTDRLHSATKGNGGGENQEIVLRGWSQNTPIPVKRDDGRGEGSRERRTKLNKNEGKRCGRLTRPPVKIAGKKTTKG